MQNITNMTCKVEVHVVGDIDGRGCRGGGGVVHDELVVVVKAEGYGKS